MRADPLLAPVFGQMGDDHPAHVAAFLAGVLGGPADYSAQHGGHPHMVRQHRDRHQQQQAQRVRWSRFMLETADELPMPDDPRFRSALGARRLFGMGITSCRDQFAAGSRGRCQCADASLGMGRGGRPYLG